MIQPVVASSALETLQTRAHEKHLSDHPYWRRLLHYRRNLWGVYQSEIDDSSFFVSPRGRRDAGAELGATLAAFFKPAASESETTQHPQCRYPARFAWLQEQLEMNLSPLPHPDCVRYEKWKSQVNPESVSLVFASSYMNNPSSMYGHTFLLLKKKGHSAQERLLDYVVNFAADLEADSGFLYAVKGLAGGYHGRFSTFPYYMKVQEYNNLESRDLWEYELHLSTPGIERLVQHLWELGNVRIRYFFLNKNCSYHLMPLLEAVEPDRDFKKEFVLKTIPVDTVRTVMRQPGFVGDITRRPSHTSKLIAERSRLTDPEIRLAEEAARDPFTAKTTRFVSLPPERQALVLDAAYDLFRYKVGFLREQPPEVEQKENELLLLRNKIPSPSVGEDVGWGGASLMSGPPPSSFPTRGEGNNLRPDSGHPTGRIGLSYGFSNRSHFEELSLRPAIHDQEDPPEGYLPGSKLEMFHAKLRYDNDRDTLYLQQFALIDLLSITPYDRWIHPPSWKVSSGIMVANDLNRDPENSLYYGLNLGTGYSAWVPGTDDKALVYGMAEMELEVGHAFDDSVRFGGGPSGGILFNPVRFWRARLQMSHFPYAVGGTPSTTKLGLYQSVSLSKDFELRTKLERQNTYKEVLLTWVWFL